MFRWQILQHIHARYDRNVWSTTFVWMYTKTQWQPYQNSKLNPPMQPPEVWSTMFRIHKKFQTGIGWQMYQQLSKLEYKAFKKK
jgi:hypothetical protein